MNESMFFHQATQDNLAALKKYGAVIVGPLQLFHVSPEGVIFVAYGSGAAPAFWIDGSWAATG